MSGASSIEEWVDLTGKNSLRISACARYYLKARSAEQVRMGLAFASEQGLEILILGGGSNLVFAGDFQGLVIEMALTGRCWRDIDGDEATLELGAGENWHEAVLYAARAGFRGIENLALIPGTTGAAPVQNIGAYGTELKDTLISVTALDRADGHEVLLSNQDCQFAYRDSLFKHEPGRFVILRICLRLSRSRPFTLGYQDLSDYLGDEDPSALLPLDVAEAVMAVRRRKLPDPTHLPNAGSFFKNPVVPIAEWHALKDSNPEMAGYVVDDSTAKIAAAWLIDQCGWKGFRDERVGVHNRQALVLVNHSGGSGQDVLSLADRIREDVKATFGVMLEMEPGIIGTES